MDGTAADKIFIAVQLLRSIAVLCANNSYNNVKTLLSETCTLTP